MRQSWDATKKFEIQGLMIHSPLKVSRFFVTPFLATKLYDLVSYRRFDKDQLDFEVKQNYCFIPDQFENEWHYFTFSRNTYA